MTKTFRKGKLRVGRGGILTHLKICQSVTTLFGLGDHDLKNTWQPMVLTKRMFIKGKPRTWQEKL